MTSISLPRSHWQKVPLSVIAQVAEVACRAFGLVLISRLLPAAELGRLIVWGTLCAFGSVWMGLGGTSNAAIQIARVPSAMRSTFRKLAMIRFRLWLLTLPVGLVAALLMGDSLLFPALFALVLLFGGAGLFAGGSFGVLGLSGALDAHGLVVRDSVYRALAALFGLGLVLVLYLNPGRVHAEWIPLIPLLAGLLLLGLSWPVVHQRLEGDGPVPPTFTLLRDTAQLWSYVALGLVQAEIGILILDAFVPAHELGVYGIAARVGAILLLPATTLGRLLAPKVAAPAADERERLGRLWPSFRIAVITLVPAGVLLSVGLADYCLLPLGPEYAGGSVYLRILSLELVTTALSFAPALWLAVHRETRYFIGGLVLGAVASIILGLLWIPAFGAIGAAYAHFIALLSCQLVHVLGFFRSVRRLAPATN